MKGLVLSVGQLNEYVRKSLAGDPMLRSVCIQGELSNFKRHVSGHWYFSLKDADAAINCAMFRQATQTVRFEPQNGRRVRLFGSVGLYVKTGSYQFYADMMEPDGVGELYLRFETLKQKLADEGLFDASLKKPLPLLPRGVGIITSGTGAVIHDIMDVSRRRNAGVPLYLCPVKVQGDGAAQEIADAIRLLDAYEPVDVVIVGRGGGSMEDLQPFNEECVARAIAACAKPVVSAVGHETDFSIADFVSDLRAPTPSAAAELVVPQKEALLDAIRALVERMTNRAGMELGAQKLRVAELQKRLTLASPERVVEGRMATLRELAARMECQVSQQLAQKAHALENATVRLRAVSPMATVKRGYAIVTRGQKPVRDAKRLAAGDELHIILASGSANAQVTHIDKEESAWLP